MLFILGGSKENTLKKYLNFIISLAEQSWLNEYVYIQSEKEVKYISELKHNIENDEKINELKIALFACYTPLNSSKIIVNKLLNYKSVNFLFNDLITIQIKEPLKEKELIKSINTFDVIEDSISKKVRDQYEEHPYPRWRYIDNYSSHNFFKNININIKPNSIDNNNKFNNPSVLIAGCGTGSHSIVATRYKNSHILAVDLSLTSLAYAKRKIEELGYKNIEYLHADILQLKKLKRKFDIIESVGTLHHMKDPVKGLKVLLNILKPHGFLRLGLYSELARQSVVAAKELIKKRNYKNTSKDIRIFRQEIFNRKEDPIFEKITHYTDFYSTSMARDLLFHVQEHRFTIIQISKILKDLNLEFLGFDLKNFKSKIEYSKMFKNDKKNISLDNWHQFEINNPHTFIGMYQFWVRKK
jgi:SAM-dependent methyltransferase